MKHKYIQDLGIKEENTPFGYCNNEKGVRKRKWQQERYKYGFDSRETWNMDVTLIILIYERLMMYNEKNCIATDREIVAYKGKFYSMQELIDKILEKCRNYIIYCDNELKYSNEEAYKIIKQTTEVFDILSVLWRKLWW